MGTAAAATLLDINGTIKDGEVKIIPQKGQKEPKLIDPNAGKPIELLVMGQDTRDGADNASIGGGDTSEGSHQADTTMVVQISADRSYINLVSIPRDSLVDAPSCETSKGTISAQYNVMFNSIFANGYTTGDDLASAASCTVNAVNSLTGLNIQNFIVVDFNGLKDMINAIGGVKICIPSDVKDPYTGLDLTRGLHQLDGLAATQYARTRYSLGDGSDVQRTTRQQYLIKQLLQQALDKNIFTHTSELYQLAKSALKSLNISQGLADTATLAGLAMSLKNLNVSQCTPARCPWCRRRATPTAWYGTPPRTSCGPRCAKASRSWNSRHRIPPAPIPRIPTTIRPTPATRPRIPRQAIRTTRRRPRRTRGSPTAWRRPRTASTSTPPPAAKSIQKPVR